MPTQAKQERMARYVVVFTDKHPQWGGVTEVLRCDYLQSVRCYAEREVESAEALGMGPITYRIVEGR